MGRWAQAERRGRQGHPTRWGTFVAQSIVFNVSITLNWAANTDPDVWEVEFAQGGPPLVVAYFLNATGGARSRVLQGSFVSGRWYGGRVRPWLRGIPGPWSNQVIGQAP